MFSFIKRFFGSDSFEVKVIKKHLKVLNQEEFQDIHCVLDNILREIEYTPSNPRPYIGSQLIAYVVRQTKQAIQNKGKTPLAIQVQKLKELPALGDEYLKQARSILESLDRDTVETLEQIVRHGPIWDGNLISKHHRDILLEAGLIVKICFKYEDGYQAASFHGKQVLNQNYTIKVSYV